MENGSDRRGGFGFRKEQGGEEDEEDEQLAWVPNSKPSLLFSFFPFLWKVQDFAFSGKPLTFLFIFF